jgi:hypothetical protein
MSLAARRVVMQNTAAPGFMAFARTGPQKFPIL